MKSRQAHITSKSSAQQTIFRHSPGETVFQCSFNKKSVEIFDALFLSGAHCAHFTNEEPHRKMESVVHQFAQCLYTCG